MKHHRPQALLTVVIGLAVALTATVDGPAGAQSSTSAAAPSAATVTAPVPASSGKGQAAPNMPADIGKKYGYVEEERFVSGSATKYSPTGPVGDDGNWTVQPSGTAPYTTRIKVRRPRQMIDFDGTVVVEWFNVTGGNDIDPDFELLYPVLAHGTAYVGVSAQAVGVNEGGGLHLDVPGAPPVELTLPLKSRDPVRYASLSHPGDDYSYDIVTQVAELARSGKLLDGRKAKRVLLVGESQSAGRIVTYIDAIAPVTKAFDGYFVHSRGGKPAVIASDQPTPMPTAARIRTDGRWPVFQFETEADVGPVLHFLPARQPDTRHIATWEVAGTAHADDAIVKAGQRATGAQAFDIFAVCGTTPNTGPHAEVLRAAYAAFISWLDDGKRPPQSPMLATNGDQLVRDEHDNATGGIRTPDVGAPIASLLPQNSSDNRICSLFGETQSFAPETIQALYPTHAAYVAAVKESADAAVSAGFLLRADRDAMVVTAQRAEVPPKST